MRFMPVSVRAPWVHKWRASSPLLFPPHRRKHDRITLILFRLMFAYRTAGSCVGQDCPFCLVTRHLQISPRGLRTLRYSTVSPQTCLPSSDLFQAFKRVWIFADQKYESGCLTIRSRTALFPFLQGSFIDPQLACEHSS